MTAQANAARRTRSLTATVLVKATTNAKAAAVHKAKVLKGKKVVQPSSPTSSNTQASSPPRLLPAEERALQLLKKKKQVALHQAEQACQQDETYNVCLIPWISTDYCIAIHQQALAIAEAEAEVEEDLGNDDNDEDKLVYPPDVQSGVANEDADEALFSTTFSSELVVSFFGLEANLYIQVLYVMTRMKRVTLVLMVAMLMLTFMNLESRAMLPVLMVVTTLISLEWTLTSTLIMYVVC